MFDTPLFYVLLIITASFFFLVAKESVHVRAVTLSIVSILVLVFVIKLQPVLIALILSAAVWIIVGTMFTRHIAQKSPYLASFIIISPVLALWILGKQAVALDWGHLSFLYFMGFSFFLIKAWTLVKDFHDGRIKRADPLVILAYFFFFPTYMSGPMHYYNEFDNSIRNPKGLDSEAMIDVVFRILLGLVKVKVLAVFFLPLSMEALKESGNLEATNLIVGCFAYSFVIWFDFSGYSDLAIATSRLLGIYTPENFNNPYRAPNIREFWQRWHITFSRVLTLYLFVPISRRLQGIMGGRRKTIMIISYLATFLFCGYWHGPTMNYLLWGLYHGIGLIIYDLYRPIAARRRLKRKGKPRSRAAQAISEGLAVAFNFSFVSLGWVFFVLPMEMIMGG